ncbi:hypothetical protein [Bifidobacterium felsineum]|uniref:hypothetical protein n=1 Tax=Bifidobacterium felsineum TaxID=2045440 RepID=UPI001BDCD245|nr:hypothetical protein [Bifidobacterium felsineum]MBT1164571.1 hypothetical protein [Bifidobacterium felsineum]
MSMEWPNLAEDEWRMLLYTEAAGRERWTGDADIPVSYAPILDMRDHRDTGFVDHDNRENGLPHSPDWEGLVEFRNGYGWMLTARATRILHRLVDLMDPDIPDTAKPALRECWPDRLIRDRDPQWRDGACDWLETRSTARLVEYARTDRDDRMRLILHDVLRPDRRLCEGPVMDVILKDTGMHATVIDMDGMGVGMRRLESLAMTDDPAVKAALLGLADRIRRLALMPGSDGGR